MSTTEMGLVGVVLAFALILISGILLWRSGKPYSTALLTIHKLVGIAAGVWLGVLVYRAHQAASLGPSTVAAVVATVLLFIVTVAAGGLLSIDRPAPGIVRRLHQVVPVLVVLATAGMLYLLLAGS